PPRPPAARAPGRARPALRRSSRRAASAAGADQAVLPSRLSWRSPTRKPVTWCGPFLGRSLTRPARMGYPHAGKADGMTLRATLVLALVLVGATGRAEVQPDGAYRGAGACASPNCHGSVTPRADSLYVLQNEYATWRSCDRHASSWAVLHDPRSVTMAKRLGMTEDPWNAHH